MLETHIVMSSLICHLILMFRLALTLVLHLALFHVLCLSLLIDLTIAHIVSRVGPVFLLEGLTLTLSRDIRTTHIFPIMVHVPLGPMVSCKGL
jgi:hypothetical protein